MNRLAGCADVVDEDPAFAGGSYEVVQKYLHDLNAWNVLPVKEQERAFGRHKLTNIEFPDAASHDADHIELYLQESLTFLAFTAGPSVPFRAG